MAHTKRTKTGQAKHDKAVLRSATWYDNKGYKVSADLPGHNKPKKIGGFVPDVIARKGKREVILEVETKKTNKPDMPQQKAFRTYANRKSNRTFRKKII